MKSPYFRIIEFDEHDKMIAVEEDCENNPLRIEVDFDDVDREVVERKVRQLVEVLNAHWDPEQFEVWRPYFCHCSHS
jgi:hypothetical protein